jgi:hypothetical protein
MAPNTATRIRRLGVLPTVGALTAGMLTPLLITSVAAAAAPHTRQPVTRMVKAGAPLKYHATHTGGKAYAPGEEIRDTGGGADPDARMRHGVAAIGVPRTPHDLSRSSAAPTAATSDGITRTAPKRLRSFQGLNHFDSRFANNGNQFSGEPPDQGLCVGKGVVVEVVNNVIRIYKKNGQPSSGAEDLNTFLGYKAAIDRTTGKFGPNVFDVSCLFDPATKQFFFVADTLMVDRDSGNLTGQALLDIAVTGDPAGKWKHYRLDVTDDGSNGTPIRSGCPCFGDYPHIGVDANGFYLTTNEFPTFKDGFDSSQVYAFSKSALAKHQRNVFVTQYDTTGLAAGNQAFTVWPAQSPVASQFATTNHGIEYFMSSTNAVHNNGASTHVVVWALTHTDTIGTAHPTARLHDAEVKVLRYSVPPPSDQKTGRLPLRDCLNDTDCATTLNSEPDPDAPETLQPLDSNDGRMQQVTYARGLLYGALDTAVAVGGATKAGIAYFVIAPTLVHGRLHAEVRREGTVALADNNLIYPSVGVTSSGRGIISFTLVGADYFPSAAFVGLDAKRGAGQIQLAARGVGPQDGFAGYKYYDGGGPGVARPRWGDYGATAVDGANIWAAAEYIAQSCTLTEYEAAPFGTCGGTRSALANWSTRVTLIKP